MDSYLKTRIPLKRIFVLLDARHGMKLVDKKFVEQLESACRPYQFILTKCDLVPAADLARRHYLLVQVLSALFLSLRLRHFKSALACLFRISRALATRPRRF
eukprot:m.131245 g.131245  ORF g.131245 m.131245 type:complete len:102 (+) comp52367_c0_seq3:945-1250(+)